MGRGGFNESLISAVADGLVLFSLFARSIREYVSI